MQRRYTVVAGNDLPQILELFYSAEVCEFVVAKDDCLDEGELDEVSRDVCEAHVAEVNCLFIASLGMSNL